jgi:ABC-type transport system substrate-binding protein
MISNVLAESVDVLLPLGPDLESALEVRQRWEGTGNHVTIAPTGALRYLQIQHRIEYARPRNGLTARLVRQAFYHATDRQAVADIATVGTAPIADSWIPPTHELSGPVQTSIPKFPFDLALARDRLAQAGWVRTADAVLAHQSTGERFDVELRSSPGAGAERILATIADGWKAIGAQSELVIVPAARSSDAEYRATLPGAGITGNIHDSFFTEALHSKHVAGPANRWTAANRSGYARPEVDALYDRLGVTIAPPERLGLHKALLAEAMGDVAIIPLYWELAPLLALRGVRGIGGMMDNTNTWNMFEWDKD